MIQLNLEQTPADALRALALTCDQGATSHDGQAATARGFATEHDTCAQQLRNQAGHYRDAANRLDKLDRSTEAFAGALPRPTR